MSPFPLGSGAGSPKATPINTAPQFMGCLLPERLPIVLSRVQRAHLKNFEMRLDENGQSEFLARSGSMRTYRALGRSRKMPFNVECDYVE